MRGTTAVRADPVARGRATDGAVPAAAESTAVAQRVDGAGRAATCGVCGTAVPPGRVLCPACGRPVATGAPGAARAVQVPDRAYRPGPSTRVVGTPTSERGPSRTGRVLRALLLLALAAAAGVAFSWATTRSGPVLEPLPEPTETGAPAPVFDPTAFPADAAPLDLVGVGATGSLDESRWPVAALVDGDTVTGWVGSPPPPDAGVVLVPEGSPAPVADDVIVAVALEGTSWVRRIEFVNGSGSVGTPARLLGLRTPTGAEVDLELLPVDGWQEVVLPEPVLTDRLELVVLAGTEPDEPVAIRELRAFGHVVQVEADAGTDPGGATPPPADDPGDGSTGG